MFFSFRIRRRVGIICSVVLALLIVVLTLQKAVATEVPEGSVPLPIIMYHSLLKDSSRQGQYVISPDLLESDIKYLKEQGYTTVDMQDLIDYVYNGVPLPLKPIMLTFDDGYYNNYLYAYPLMKQYGFKMVLSPIGFFTEQYTQSSDKNPNYSHCSWQDLKEMADSGLVEIQNHTYNMHTYNKTRKGSKRVNGEPLEKYTSVLTSDVSKLQIDLTNKIGITPNTFTYPFGAVSKESLPILKKLGFQATLTCNSHINYITKEKDCLYGLGRYLRPSGLDSRSYFRNTVKLCETGGK